jgi:hypothetical protein
MERDDAQRQLKLDIDEVKDVMLEMQAAAFDRAQTYTTVVIFGGYAGLFAIWTLTREHLAREVSLWVALLLGISVLTFVLFEIFKMVVNSYTSLAMSALILNDVPPAEFLRKREDVVRSQRLLQQRYLVPIWSIALMVSVGTGIGAACILLLAAAAALL